MTSDTSKTFYSRWTNIPFAPAKVPFFYGWVIVAVSTLFIVCSIPGQTTGVGPFTESLIAALGISRQALSNAYMVGTIGSGLILPYSGKLLDKIGVRFMSVFAAGGLALSLLFLSNAGIIRNFLDSDNSSETLAFIVASFSFLLIRFFGQGNMTMVGRVAMARWFNHWRGTATAISGVPVAFAFSAAPLLMNMVIRTFGWREGFWFMSLILGGVLTVVGLLLFRDKPEDCGLRMDGMSPEKEKSKNDSQLHKINHEFTRPEAIKTLAFWAITFGLAINALFITAIAFHITSIAEDTGRIEDKAMLVFLYSSFIAIPTRFAVSYLVDNTRFEIRWVLLMLAFLTFGIILGMSFFYTDAGFILAAISIGMGGGVWGVLINVSYPRYYGREHLGSVSGLGMSIVILASAMGPAFFSFGKNFLGSYKNASLSIMVFPLLIGLMTFFVRNPQLAQDE